MEIMDMQGMQSERLEGTVKKWLSRGYGFIENRQTGADIFCHISQVRNTDDGEERKFLNIGENVTFEIDTDQRTGKLRAVQVIGDGTGSPPKIDEDRGDRFNDRGQRRRGGGFGFRNNNNRGGDNNSGGFRNNYNRGGGFSNPYRSNQNDGYGSGRQQFGFG